MVNINPEIRRLHAPEPLRDLNAWLVWRFEHFTGEAKPRKVPYWAGGTRRHGQQGGPIDRERLTTFAAAREAASRNGFDGVGFALLPEWGITALDFDNCVAPDGGLPPEIEQIAATTYTEYSPSGKGIRAFLRGNLGNHKSLSTAEQYGLETFSTKGFVTCTGDMLPGVDLVGHEDTVAPLPAHVVEMCQRRFGATASTSDPDDFMAGYEPRLGLTPEQIGDMLDALDPGMGRGDWLTVGMALHHEFEGEEAGLDLWNDWSAGAHNYVSEDDLRYQWERMQDDGNGRRRITMASVIKMANDARRIVSSDQLTTIADQQREAAHEAFDGKFRPVRVSALPSEPPRWLIKGVLPRTEDPIILFGPSTAGKSFVCIDFAAAIDRGVAWRGRKVAKGRVLYITAEGARGFRMRMQAYCQKHNLAIRDLAIDVVHVNMNLLQAEDVRELVKTISAFGPYDAVIIDTLAQVTPGANENAGEDMGLALANIKAVQQATHATVIVVHHSGKDVSRGARGWSGLKAAAEAQIEVIRDEDSGAREILIEKMKDGQDGVRFGFTLDEVALGMDEDGDVFTSCVVAEADVVQREVASDRKNVKRRGKMANHVLDVIAQIPADQQTIKLERLVTMAAEAMPTPEGGKRDIRRQVVIRAIKTLAGEKADAPIAIVDGIVVLCCD